MSITSYPRVTVQGTNALNNTQNGNALMILNPSTGLYEAATASTFGGGGGGGSATAANQTTQIGLETTLNSIVSTASNQATEIAAINALPTSGLSTSALQTTLNSLVSTAANQTTEITNTTSIRTLLNENNIIVNKFTSSYSHTLTVSDIATCNGYFGCGTIPNGYICKLMSGDAYATYSTAGSVTTDGDTTHRVAYVLAGGIWLSAYAANNYYIYLLGGNIANLTIYKISDLT